MTTKHLHILGIDPGGTTGWARLTVPRMSIFGDEPSEIWEWDYGIFDGDEIEQAISISRLARTIQGLDYKTGPALMVEDWDQDPRFKSTDPTALSPVRIGSYLRLLHHQGAMGDSTLTFQGRTIAKRTATDDRLHAWHLYVANDHIRDAIRHAVVGLRRAADHPFGFGLQLWPYPPNGMS
jgi:hypothetical protein